MFSRSSGQGGFFVLAGVGNNTNSIVLLFRLSPAYSTEENLTTFPPLQGKIYPFDFASRLCFHPIRKDSAPPSRRERSTQFDSWPFSPPH